ncbi:MAG: RNA-binding protein [Deltaproteobacteria bacterium]|nr:RNA-binding protein [Deltaproteobacteria bacterium]MBI2500600.1 RNA-binding protein [Deltaproteobacteria bacterium]MBI4197144.1 RNA-binding protein [Deltaproteobacteria bacterium]
MGKRLYVGNLPFTVTSDQLREHFSQHGTVETAEVVMDRFSGRSKGFGFVEMSTDEEAQAVIGKLNGQDFSGRQLTVNEARPKTEGGGGGGGRDRFPREGRGGGGGRPSRDRRW